MSRVVLDIIVVLIIILIGGFFAGSEMALVSLREGQVRALSKRGGGASGPPGWPRTRTGSSPPCRSA